MDIPGRLLSAESVRRFALAGKATLTIRSAKTGTRYTFKIRKPDEDEDRPQRAPVFFVSVMFGADNENSFVYLGLIRSTPA